MTNEIVLYQFYHSILLCFNQKSGTNGVEFDIPGHGNLNTKCTHTLSHIKSYSWLFG